MRTCNILLLTICILIAACKKDKVTPPTPPVTTDPDVLVDTFMKNYPELYISVDQYLKIYDDQYHRYFARYIPMVTDGLQITEDLGGISYNGVSLIRMTGGDPMLENTYLWPDGTTPLPEGGIWTITANQYFPQTKLTDPVQYPELISFPDTILKSSPTITVRTEKVYELEIRANYDTALVYPYNYHINTNDKDSLKATFTPTALIDSVYITVVAKNRVYKYHNKICFDRSVYWSKWVYIKD